MKYTFNSTTYALISTVGEEVWVRGDNNTKVLQFYFTDTEPITDYECRAIIKRANGDVSNELYCTPINSGSEKYYKLAIKGWVTDYSGTVEITVRRKKFNSVTNEYDIITYGLITKDVSTGVLPETSNTITEEQYLLLLSQISGMEQHLVTNLGVVANFDDIIIDGLYQFTNGILLVETIGEITKQYKLQLNDKNLPSTKQFNGIAEHRYLDNDVWSVWNDEIGVESIISTFARFRNVQIDESLSVGDSITSVENFSNYNETNTLKVKDKVIDDLPVQRDVEVGRNLLVKGESEFQGGASVGGIFVFEQSPKSLDNPGINVDLTNKMYVDNADSVLNNKINEIVDGTTIVKKTERDSQNNVIHNHYATKNELTEHDNNPNAHLSIRQEIEEVRQDVGRIGGRGKSYGELNFTQSELLAMIPSVRNEEITEDIQGTYPFYTPQNGDLVYSKEVETENTHEWEYNSDTSSWVDNGAYVVQKASNSIYGIVKGDNDYVNIVNGILEILKSNYATRVGTDLENGYTFEQLNTLITTLENEVADRYTKGQVYTKLEIDNLINMLKAVYGWEEDVIWGQETVSSTKSIPLVNFEDYSYIIIQKLDPGITLSVVRSDILNVNDVITKHIGGLVIAYDELLAPNIYVEYNGGNLTFHDSNGLYNVYGFKMMPLTADKVGYGIGTVKSALDEINSNGFITNERISDKSITPEKLSFTKPSKNLFNKDTSVDAPLYATTGLLGSGNAEYYTSDFIEVLPNKNYTQNSVVGGSGIYNSVFYDINKNYISSVPFNQKTYTTPENCFYIRVCFRLATTLKTNAQFEMGNFETDYEPYFLGIPFENILDLEIENKHIKEKEISYDKTNFISIGKNLFNKDNIFEGYLDQTTGNFILNINYVTSDFIEVKPNTNYVLGRMEQGRGGRFCFYDETKAFISGLLEPNIPILTPSNCKYVRFSFSESVNGDRNTQQLEEGNSQTTYQRFGYYIINGLYREEKQGDFFDVDIILPPTIPAVVGKELNIYLDNIINDKVENYQIKADCSIGGLEETRFTVIPLSAGTYPLNITIYKNYQQVKNISCNIVVNSVNVGAGINKDVLIIGDSTTANGVVVSEVINLFSNDVMSINFIGTKGNNPALHEGISGWTTTKFYTNITSPFVKDGLFDFSNYMITNSYNNVDYVIINLGINDIFGYSNLTSLMTKINLVLTQYQGMIDNIKLFNENIKIGLAITIPPNFYQDAFALDYKNIETRWNYKMNNFIWVKNLINTFKNKEDENIFLVPINVNIDTANNFDFAEKEINARNSKTVTKPAVGSGVHPAISGYYQIADIYYYWLKSFEV